MKFTEVMQIKSLTLRRSDSDTFNVFNTLHNVIHAPHTPLWHKKNTPNFISGTFTKMFAVKARDTDGRDVSGERSNIVLAKLITYPPERGRVHGKCQPGVSQCVCDTGWTGQLCDISKYNTSFF